MHNTIKAYVVLRLAQIASNLKDSYICLISFLRYINYISSSSFSTIITTVNYPPNLVYLWVFFEIFCLTCTVNFIIGYMLPKMLYRQY